MAIIAIGPVPPTTVFTEPPISCFWLPETSTARLPPTEATSCRSMRLVRSFNTRVVWSFWAWKNWFSLPASSSKVISLKPSPLWLLERNTMRVLLAGRS
ncbi:hypothetical protein D3C78_1117240 [compost metagenome]